MKALEAKLLADHKKWIEEQREYKQQELKQKRTKSAAASGMSNAPIILREIRSMIEKAVDAGLHAITYRLTHKDEWCGRDYLMASAEGATAKLTKDGYSTSFSVDCCGGTKYDHSTGDPVPVGWEYQYHALTIFVSWS